MPWNRKTSRRDRKVKARGIRRKRNAAMNRFRMIMRELRKLPPGVILHTAVFRNQSWDNLIL